MTETKPTDSVDGRKETDSHANGTSMLSRTPSVRLAVGLLAFAATTVATCPIARYRMFTGFARYDDEGDLLISLKSFLNHGWLYDVFIGYGPFYYEFWGVVFSVFGIPVNHDGGRTVTMVVWVLSSLLIGLSTWRMAGSIVLGLATQAIAFVALVGLAAEPMHPGGLIVLLVSAIMAFSCFVRDHTSLLPMAVLGGAVMALVLVKINVGIFALAALVLVCVVTYPALARLRWLRPVVEVGFVALPLLLMASKAGEAWVRHYAFHVFAAALAVVIALRARGVGRRDSKELWWLAGGLLVVGATVFVAIVAAGTRPFSLIELITLPMRFVAVRPSLALILPNWTYILDLLALGGAIGYRYAVRNREALVSRTWTYLISALSILIGILMAFSVIAPPSMPLFTPLGLVCFAWLALIQPPGKQDEATEFTRILLPPLAVLQALHAFPVAGSQVLWSALLLIPVGALCIANGLRWIAFSRGGQNARTGPLTIGAVAATLAVVVLVSVLLKQMFDQVRAAYDGSVSLELPGAEDVRVSPEAAANYRAIVAAIDENCKSFVMLPGMNSFYMWARQDPPSGDVAPELPALWESARQQRLIEATRSIDGLCLVENVPLAQWWAGGTVIPPGPLDRYLHQGFVPVAKFGDYRLLKREGSGSRS